MIEPLYAISEEIEDATITADGNTKVGRFKTSRNLVGILTNIIKIKKLKLNHVKPKKNIGHIISYHTNVMTMYVQTKMK